jgi:hypothetical protein
MSRARIGFRAALVAVVCAVGLLADAGSAVAETKTFTSQECRTWEVPAGVKHLKVAAVGGAGQPGERPEGGAGGAGDEVTATVKVAGNEVLDVCIGFGGGTGGVFGGGKGGGASGLARGKDFSVPVLVAGGGGGGGHRSFGDEGDYSGGSGGAARMAGKPKQGGTAGGGTVGGGTKSNSEGPGHGGAGMNQIFLFRGGGSQTEGAGGGGGGGYLGGGGGGISSGGAGGTDFCEDVRRVRDCATNAEVGTGIASVTITYRASVTITYRTHRSHRGGGHHRRERRDRGTGPAGPTRPTEGNGVSGATGPTGATGAGKTVNAAHQTGNATSRREAYSAYSTTNPALCLKGGYPGVLLSQEGAAFKNGVHCLTYAGAGGQLAGVNAVAEPAVGGLFTVTCSGFGLRPTAAFYCGAEYRPSIAADLFSVATDGTVSGSFILRCSEFPEQVVSGLFVEGFTAEGGHFYVHFPPPSGC